MNGAPLRRLMVYAHDTYGLGHLRRCLAIIGAALSDTPPPQVVLASGSSVADRYPLSADLTLVPLPPVVKAGAGHYVPRDPRHPFGLVRRARTAILSDLVRRFRPEVLLVDHAPLGMGGELVDVFAGLRRHSPHTRLVLGLRDILDDPEVVRSTWAAQGIPDVLAETYDRVLVYGCRDLFDVGDAYNLPEAVRRNLVYTGYVAPPRTSGEPREDPLKKDARLIVATAGGGGDGYPVLAATLAAARELAADCLVVTGPLMAQAERAALAELAADTPGARVLEFVPDVAALLSAADVAVTMGGYNTLCEAVRDRARLVVVPRTHPRREQEIRAHMFAARGLADVVLPGPMLAGRLTTTLAAVLARGPALAQSAMSIDLGGADRVRAVLAAEAARGRSGRLSAGSPSAGWLGARKVPA